MRNLTLFSIKATPKAARLQVWLLALVTSSFWLQGCTKDAECRHEADISAIKVPEYRLVRMEGLLINCKSAEETKALMDKESLFSYGFLQRRLAFPNDSIFVEEVDNSRLDTNYRRLVADCQQVFPAETPFKAALDSAFRHLLFYYPTFKVPTVYTVVTGFENYINTNDSLIVIPLENFKGKAGIFNFPPFMPMYIQRRMVPKNVVPSLMFELSKNFAKTNMAEGTLLERMIDYGKRYYFVKHTMPCNADSNIIGFTNYQMDESRDNLGRIWGFLLSNKLVYSTDQLEYRKFVEERPNAPEIGEKCPGRIARYIGWLIVEEYAKKTGKTLQEVLSEPDAKKILRDSGFRPKDKT
jgi:hypothetical protein